MSKKITTVADVKDRCRMGEGGCWEWALSLTKTKHRVPVARLNGSMQSVPRWVFNEAVRPVLSTEIVWRACRNERCCNPQHLRAGTSVEYGEWISGLGVWRMTPNRVIAMQAVAEKRRRLTPEQAQEVRISSETRRAIAERFGVSTKTISKYRRRASGMAMASVFSWRP